MNYSVDQISNLLLDRGQSANHLIEHFESIESTNSYLLNQKSVSNRVCLAENQTGGRGRRGRQWQSMHSGSILMSMGWELQGQDVSGLSLVMGIAVVSALQEFGLENVGLKWPNDLLVKGEKIGGILVELSGRNCVVGLGLNVDTPFDGQVNIDLPWTDLSQQGLDVDKNKLVVALVSNFEKLMTSFIVSGFAQFQSHWNALHVYQNKAVIVSMPEKEWIGLAKGVDSRGALLVEIDGQTKCIESGEVSIRLCDLPL
ncbi:MAG: biotin--[acetyl-CoA-carboxylase] ligase [Gammaproteobacteria bacterium]|nr:biotin--[acetyl-CoA-carboxylase] ligase [Gammaproteobacteria bacterium]